MPIDQPIDRRSNTKAPRCLHSGAIIEANEAQRFVRCSCGFSIEAYPLYNRRIAGEIMLGWTVRMPVHNDEKA